jgi:hypothetical protein
VPALAYEDRPANLALLDLRLMDDAMPPSRQSVTSVSVLQRRNSANGAEYSANVNECEAVRVKRDRRLLDAKPFHPVTHC